MKNGRHIAKSSRALPAAALVVCVGAGAFALANLGGEAFDPSAFLESEFSRQSQPEYDAAFDVDRTEEDGDANLQADQSHEEEAEQQPDIQEVDASSFARTEGSGGSVLSVVDTPTAGGTIAGGQQGEGSTPGDAQVSGPVVNGEGNGNGNGEGEGGNSGGESGGPDGPGGEEPGPDGPGGPDDPVTPPLVDPDPRPTLPEDMLGSGGWIETHPFPEGGVEVEPDEFGEVSVEFSAYTDEYMLEDPEALGMERLYYGMILDDWKLLCSTYFYVTVNHETTYRLEQYSENFKVGEFPRVVDTDTLEVEYYFRLNANDAWQTEKVTYPIHPYKVIVPDWNGDPLKTRYPDLGGVVYLDNVYTRMLPASSESGAPLAALFSGWSATEGGEPIGPQYAPQDKGRIVLNPLPLVPVPPEFKVTNEWDKQCLVDYTGTSQVCAIPEGVQSIDLPYLEVLTADVIKLPASLQYGAGQLSAVRTYEVAEGNPTYFVQDGMLFDSDSGMLMGIPLLQETVKVPAGTPFVNLQEGNRIKRIEFAELADSADFSLLNDADIVVPANLYVDFLEAWGAHPGNDTNRLVADTGEEFDYVVRDGGVFSSDGKTMHQVLAQTEGVYFVPDGVRVVEEGAFAESPGVTAAVLPASLETLERNSLVGERLTRVFFEGSSAPAADAEAFGTAKAHVRFASFAAYATAWGTQMGADVASNVLVRDEFLVTERDGYRLLRIAVKNADGSEAPDGKEAVVLSAPSDVVAFTPDSLPDENVTALDAGAFEGCVSLSFVDLPDSVTVLGPRAFSGCENLQAFFSAASDAITIGAHAFDGCGALRFAAFSAQKAYIDDWASLNASGFEAYAPYGSTGYDDDAPSIYQGLFTTDFADMQLSRQNGGALLYGIEAYSDELCMLGATSNVSGTVALADGTVCLLDGAFADCTDLVGLDDASWAGLKEIGDGAFARTGLKSALIGEHLRYLGTAAFWECASLTQVEFQEGIDAQGKPTGVDYVQENMFTGCTQLTRVDFPSTVLWVGYNIFDLSGVERVSFSGAEPPTLVRPSANAPYVFSEHPAPAFLVELVGAAEGQEEAYEAAWKYSLLGQMDDSELSPEDDLRGTNLVRALFGLPPVEELADEPSISENEQTDQV